MSDKPTALRIPNAASPFRSDKSGGRQLTSDDIARHLAAFQRSGGTVEVLGTTRTLRQIVADAGAAPAAPVKPRSRSKATQK